MHPPAILRSISRTEYARVVRELSEAINQAQRPIRVLDAIRWDRSVEQKFFAQGCRELPQVDRESYSRRPLGFSPSRQRELFAGLEQRILEELGSDDPAGQLLRSRCDQYKAAIRLIEARGTAAFSEQSRMLYGTTTDPEPTARESLRKTMRFLEREMNRKESARHEYSVSAAEARDLLASRLREYFGSHEVPVQLTQNIVADAAAGNRYLKIRQGARFCLADVYLLEAHEAWVHLTTTFNGQKQPVLLMIARTSPKTARTQEGLAVLTEFLAGVQHPNRIRRLWLRLRGLQMAEQGADFLEVFQYYRRSGCESREAYQHTVRIYRGSLPRWVGPFTKDVTYSTGLTAVARHFADVLARGDLGWLHLLFSGKTALEEMPMLLQLRELGWLAAPELLPPIYQDLNSLQKAWNASPQISQLV